MVPHDSNGKEFYYIILYNIEQKSRLSIEVFAAQRCICNKPTTHPSQHVSCKKVLRIPLKCSTSHASVRRESKRLLILYLLDLTLLTCNSPLSRHVTYDFRGNLISLLVLLLFLTEPWYSHRGDEALFDIFWFIIRQVESVRISTFLLLSDTQLALLTCRFPLCHECGVPSKTVRFSASISIFYRVSWFCWGLIYFFRS